VRVNGHLAVGRLGTRSDADLAWETGLLQDLDREGLTVPLPIPTTDGRLFADGVVPSGTARDRVNLYTALHCLSFLGELGQAFNRDKPPPVHQAHQAHLEEVLPSLM